GQATLIDLSLARAPGGRHRGVGSRPYMSPEQVLGKPVGPAADVWGIGATLFEAATASRPWGDGIDTAPNSDRPRDPRAVPSVAEHRRLPTSLRELIERC